MEKRKKYPLYKLNILSTEEQTYMYTVHILHYAVYCISPAAACD